MEQISDVFDLVIDFTDFSPANELPTAWLKRSVQMCPPTTLQYLNVS